MFLPIMIFVAFVLGAIIYLDLRRVIMATKEEALAAIQTLKDTAAAEHEQVLAELQRLADIIANRPEVPDDVVAAINEVRGNIEGIFSPAPEGPPVEEPPIEE